jgi:hypothetical protein
MLKFLSALRNLLRPRSGAAIKPIAVAVAAAVGAAVATPPAQAQAQQAGDEDEACMANNAHHDLYDVNTIANYDPEIVPLLAAPVGSAYERVGGRLVPAPPVPN